MHINAKRSIRDDYILVRDVVNLRLSASHIRQEGHVAKKISKLQ